MLQSLMSSLRPSVLRRSRRLMSSSADGSVRKTVGHSLSLSANAAQPVFMISFPSRPTTISEPPQIIHCLAKDFRPKFRNGCSSGPWPHRDERVGNRNYLTHNERHEATTTDEPVTPRKRKRVKMDLRESPAKTSSASVRASTACADPREREREMMIDERKNPSFC